MVYCKPGKSCSYLQSQTLAINSVDIKRLVTKNSTCMRKSRHKRCLDDSIIYKIIRIDSVNFVICSISDQGVNFWVGANDKNSVPTFTWTNGKPLIINSNPNTDLTDATCVSISHSGGSSTYGAAKCRDKHAFICERSKSFRPWVRNKLYIDILLLFSAL